MSPQADYVVSNGTGAAVRSDINGQLAAIVSNNSGASAPATTYAYMLWADTSTNLLKLRNGANSAWITVGGLTAANLGLATLASPTFTGTATIPTLTVSTAANIPLGSAASPTLYFTGDSNTGLYSPGADQVALSTGGTGRLFIDSSGRCGIGTSSPSELFNVATSSVSDATLIRLDGGSGIRQRFFPSSGTGKFNWQIAAQSNVDNGFEITPSSTSGGSTFSTPAVVVKSDGKVGIGVTSPAATLDSVAESTNGFGVRIRGRASDSYGAIQFTTNDGSSQTAALGVSSNTLVISTGSTERARIDTSGRLLVGTSSTPNDGRLVVAGNSAFTSGTNSFGQIKIRNNNSAPSNGETIGVLEFSDSGSGNSATIIAARDGGTWTTNTSNPGRLVFSTTADGASSPTERMRVTSYGQTLFGTTTQNTGIGDLTTATGASIDGVGFIGACRPNEGAGYFTRTGTDGRLLHFYKGSSNVGGVSVTTTGATFNTSSDYRLKENITAISDAIIRLQKLKPSRFNFIVDPGNIVDGFIAHEVQTVVPEAIGGTKDEVDADGKPIYQNIDQSKLVPLLTAALQEAIGRIETLEAEVAALKAQ